MLLEDLGALLGLVFALFGVSMAVVTGDGVWDGIGTLMIGVLLGDHRGDPRDRDQVAAHRRERDARGRGAICAALEGAPQISEVIHLRTLHLGPEELLVAAKIAVKHDDTAAEIAKGIDEAERRVRDAVPMARVIYLEPDLYRTERRPEPAHSETSLSAGRR